MEPQTKIDFTMLDNVPPQAIEDALRIARDPQAFLREVLPKCEALAGYSVDFYKQERLGLFVKDLKPQEHMRVKFRAEPFSVKMDILSEHSDYSELVYVQGLSDNMLRLQPRRSPLFGEQPVKEFPPAFVVQFGRSINPVTDFGLARLMQRVIEKLDQSIVMELPPTIEYRGITTSEKDNSLVHHIRLTYSKETGYPATKVDLLFSVETLLPAASYTWLPGGQLQGRYFYTRVDPSVQFTDDDFRLAADKKPDG